MRKIVLSLDSIVTKIFTFDYESTLTAATILCIENIIDMIASKTCPFCGKRFRTGYQLTAHISNHHPDEIVRIVECAMERIKRWRET
ncbi:MAG: C2H2-type zinc finger protein [Candidatus Bathyarchaeota archaeon]|nr:C2H2-type zinc finger protein [Candidatus Bathyarchaeota archaeon]